MIVAQHRNQAYRKSKAQIYDRFDSSSSKGFKAINCRNFQSGIGILPSPPPTAFPYGSTLEPKSLGCRSEPPKMSRKSSPIAITPKPSPKFSSFCDDFSCSELWAGPAYSNSPPPSSLPIPKFSLCQKRSISLDLPGSESSIELQTQAISAPASPVRDSSLSPSADCFPRTVSATENLRRILNLDLEY